MSQWFRNGEPVTSVSVDDRAFHYGDGLFETVAIRDGEPRLWQYHVERLTLGCERLSLQMPDADVLRRELSAALRENSPRDSDCVAKIILSSGSGPRGYGRPPGTPAIALIGLFDYTAIPRQTYLDGIDTVVCDTRLAGASAVAGLKTLNRIEQVLGRNECLAAGAFEGLMLDAGRRVICGTMSNVFIVSGKSIITPSLDRCGVAGVMRRLLLHVLEDQELTVTVTDVAIDDLPGSDEVFLTNSQFGALSVRRCGENEWPVGAVTELCQRLLADHGVREYAL